MTMIAAASRRNDDDDDMLALPGIQPKSFAPLTSSSTNMYPSPKSIGGGTGSISRRGRNNILVSEGGGGGGGRYSSSYQPSPKSSPATPRTTTKLGLSLRRITPAVATPSPSPRARRRLGGGGGGATMMMSDGQHSTIGSSSLVSRITGGGRSKYSIATGATPVMRGGGGGGGRNSGSGGNPPALKKRSVDQRQRMEDEYFRPSMHWEEEDDENEDNEDNDDYNGGGGADAFMREQTRTDALPQPSPSAAAAAMLPLVSPTNQEQLKVAGFWSQLDENGADDSSEDNGDDDDNRTMENDDNQSEEEMPGDEQQHWRQSVSPPRNRRGLRNRFDRSSRNRDSHDNDASIGLDLVRQHDSEEDNDATTNTTISKSQQPKSNNISNKNGNDGTGSNKWNLLEKAACFANENKSVNDDDEESGENTSGGQYNKNDTVRLEEEDEDQSLDRSFQTSYTGARPGRDTNTTTMRAEDDADENGVLACITGALATICGYEAAENPISPNKKRAHDIIDKRRNNRSAAISDHDVHGGHYYDETNITDEEDAAIELQYHHPANPTAGGDGSGSSPLSPRRKLAFKKLLSLGKKKKGMESPTRKTLVTTTTRSGQEPSGIGGVGAGRGEGLPKIETRITDLNSSLTFEQEILGLMPGEEEEEEDDEGENIDSGFLTPLSPAMGHDPMVNKMTTIDGDNSAETERPIDKSSVASANVVLDDEEELESEAAAWSANKKNTYLRQLAERAKMEYAANAADGTAASPSNNGKPNYGTAGAAVATTAAAAVASSRSARQDDNMKEEPASVPGVETGGEQASFNADYITFSPAQKRLFLRLLNSGMSPQDAARRIAQESGIDGNGIGKHTSTDYVVKDDEDNIADDDEGEGEVAEGDEIMDYDERNVSYGSEMPSFSKMPSLRYPGDEGVPQLIPPLMTADLPGDVLSGTSGDTAKDESRENILSVSRSEMAQDDSRSNSQGRHAALASIPIVPALIRAKLRSKSKGRKQELYPTLPLQDDDDDAVHEQAGEGQSQEAPASNNVGSLVSSGIGYYDAQGRGLDQNEEEYEFDDDNADSGLLISESAPSARGRSQRHKFLGAAVANGLAAKVASSRQVGVPRERGVRYRSVDTSLANPVTMAEKDSYAVDNDPSVLADDDEDNKPIKSPRPASSALNFMNRNPTKKSGGSKQWSKLDSDMALDQVAPSRSVEVEDTPSWLVSRDDDEGNDGLKHKPEGEDDINGGEIDGDEDLPETFVDSIAAEEISSHSHVWSSSIIPEMDKSQIRDVVTPRYSDSTTSMSLSPNELASGADGEEHQNDEDMPFPPPVSPVSPDEDATSTMDRSFASTMVGSTWTSTSKSHRKRHKGAASKRILQAKEAESHNKSKGWLDSIRDAASIQGQMWDPERGWVDYTEPEVHGGQDRDYFSPGSLHFVIPPRTRMKTEETNAIGVGGKQHFPVNFSQERALDSVLRPTDGSRGEFMSFADVSIDGDDTIFDSVTVNSAMDGMSVYSNSTAAPKRRAVPRHRPTDRRKIAAEHRDKKSIGWKESMENATANVAGRYWDYERGWVRADGTVDDDVSELTRSTLEGLKLSKQGGILDRNYTNDSERNKIVLQNQHVSPMLAGEESNSLSHLPPVAEETDNAGLNPVEVDEKDYDAILIDNEDRAAASNFIDPDDDSPGNIQPSDDVVLPSIVTAGSDKENQTSPKVGNIDTSPLPPGDHRTQSLPISNNKRTLNQWLEKSINDKPHHRDISDVAAVMSHESMDSDLSNLVVEDDKHQPLPTPFHFSDIMDSFCEFENGAQEVQVVKEKCTDADSDLFEPNRIDISRSLINRLSDGFSASSRNNSASRQRVHEQPPFNSLKSQDDISSWLPPPPPDAPQADETASPTAQYGRLSSMENRTRPQRVSVVTEESSTTELDSNAPQVNTAGTPVAGDGSGSSTQKVSGIQNLDPPKSRTSRIGTRNVTKASDSWIQDRKDLKDEDEPNQGAAKGNAITANSYVGSLRSKFEREGGSKAAVITNTTPNETPVFVPTIIGVEENDVYFRSTAMGIRLKRGEDGFVRVVSVTEATNGSSIVRDGAIEPDDRVMEAAGVDLRHPISNNQWGETVTKIRNAPRPMKFVVAAGPKRDNSTEYSDAHQPSSNFPPPPAKYVMESRLSKSLEGQQVLESLSMARSYDVARAVTPPTIQQLVNSSSQTSGGGADVSNASRTVDDEETQIPPKESLLKRIAAGCASPATVCTAPTSHHPSTSSQQSQGNSNDEGSQVPMAHLQFLRTNPTIARVANAASRRYPALCGRPDTIFEEPDDDDVTRDTMTTERSDHRDRRPAYGISNRKRSSSSKDDGSQTMATYSTYDDRSAPPIGATYSTGSGSIGSGGTGDNTEFLEKLAIGSSLRSNPSNPRRDNDTTKATLSQKLGKVSYGLSEYVTHESKYQETVADDIEWPDNGEQKEVQQAQKDTINDGLSSYSSNLNQPSYLSNTRKNESARQAELLAAGKVEDMMSELHNLDPEGECEI